ncbi:MAG TPA: hypothetical protein VLX28_04385 [Thermoanaerobaculia bacterium]|nr:hypothetical protein [Thermoanaerobaculia bacterium]
MLDQTATLANVLFSSAALIGLWILFHWFYSSYRRDLLQNRLFELRQELFDYARTGAISFDDPAYGVLRTTINGFIRVGPRLSLTGVILFLCMIEEEDFDNMSEGYTARLQRLLAPLPPEAQKKLSGFKEKLNFTVLCHVIHTSVLAVAIMWPIMGIMRCLDGIRGLKPGIRLSLDRFDNAALAIGSRGVILDSRYRLAPLTVRRA